MGRAAIILGRRLAKFALYGLVALGVGLMLFMGWAPLAIDIMSEWGN